MAKNNNPYDHKKEKDLHTSYVECIKYYKKIEQLKGKLHLGAKIRTFKGVEVITTEEDIERIYKAYEMAYMQRAKRLTSKGNKSLISWITKRNEKNIGYKGPQNRHIDN